MIDVARRTVVVAFDGSLRASYLLARVAQLGHRVIAATLDTGSFGGPDEGLAETAKALGAEKTLSEDLRGQVYQRGIRGLLRHGWTATSLPTLWEAAEERVRAERLAALAKAEKGGAAGLLLPGGRVRAALARAEVELVELEGADDQVMRQALRERDLPCPAAEPEPYVLSERLWGTRIAGGELSELWEELSPDLYPNLAAPEEVGNLPEEFIVELEDGLPVAAFGNPLDGLSLFEQLSRVGRRHGVGRRLTADARSGTRQAWEAPAFEVLLTARRALERSLLPEERLALKDQLARVWLGKAGAGEWEAPVLRDIEAFTDSALRGVSGQVLLRLSHGSVTAVGIRPGPDP